MNSKTGCARKLGMLLKKEFEKEPGSGTGEGNTPPSRGEERSGTNRPPVRGKTKDSGSPHLKKKYNRKSLAKEDKSTIKALSRAAVSRIRQDSRQQARNDEAELRAFYKDPFGDGSERWHLAEFALDYLKKFKKPHKRRLDQKTTDISHELDSLMGAMAMLKAGALNGGLPRSVTIKYEDGSSEALPLSQQSIEHLFCIIAIHDLDEDFAGASVEGFRRYMRKRIDGIANASEEKKQHLYDMVDYQGECLEAITFGRKVKDKDGDTITIPTHDGDLTTYMNAMRKFWPAIAAKALDRLNGLSTRYSDTPPVNALKPDVFPNEKNMEYYDETTFLYQDGQPVEHMCDQYPQLKEYFLTMNAKLNVVYRPFHLVTSLHPNRPESKKPENIKLKTARVDIGGFLPKATRADRYLKPQHDPLLRAYKGYEQEARNYPQLQPVSDKLTKQFSYIYPDLENEPDGLQYEEQRVG